MKSTADVRPLPEIIAEIRSLIIPRLQGSKTDPYVMAVWSTVNECAETVSRADMAREDDDTSGRDSRFMAGLAGERYTAGMIVRKIADALGVDNFR